MTKNKQAGASLQDATGREGNPNCCPSFNPPLTSKPFPFHRQRR